MKKAINAWSIPNRVSFEDMFRDIAAAGFEGIELNVDAVDRSAHSLTLESDTTQYAQIRELSERYQLEVPSISTSLTGGLLGSPKAADREQYKRLLMKQIECAQALGATAVLTVPGGMNEEVSLQQAYEVTTETLQGLAADIEGSGIKVGVENVWNTFFSSPFDMVKLIDAVDSPAIGAYFDVGNVIAFSDAEDWIEILGDRIVKIHVKDYKRSGGVHRGGAFVNLLQGDVHWPEVMAALRGTGYTDYITAELEIIHERPEYLYQMTADALDIIFEL